MAYIKLYGKRPVLRVEIPWQHWSFMIVYESDALVGFLIYGIMITG